jgi:hypothetical protein
MEYLLNELVELSERELDAVAGGIRDIEVEISDAFNRVRSSPHTDITNLVDNSVHVSF